MNELPTPFYQDSAVKIYCADNRLILPLLPKVDLVLTSPPYDDLRTYKGKGFDWQSVVSSVAQIINPGSVLVWIVGDQSIDGGESEGSRGTADS